MVFKSVCILAPMILLGACSVSNDDKKIVSDADRNTQQKPNIVIFYVDDLGYGDLSAYGAKHVKTPNVDELANNGIRFTDAHSSAATCTPSRYSLLTGEYAFRNKASVLQGDAAMIIKPEQPTLAKVLKKAGYQTGVVGKWHLGLGDGKKPIDWNQAVKPGPLEIGFDYSFLLPATGDRVPTVYLENHHVLNLEKNDPLIINYEQKVGERPTGYENPELERQAADHQHNKTIINGIARIGWMQGGHKAEWKDEDFYKVFTDKANDFIRQNQADPFFLFFSFSDIHVPRLPNEQFLGKSGMGVRGDSILQMDWMTGQVVKQLKSLNLLDNTLIIFTSDNGPVLNDGYEDKAVELLGQHKPAGPYRGGKYSAYEAGTRMPTILHYPNQAKPGVSDALMSQVDIYASVANLVGVDLNQDEAIDSQNRLSAWLDASEPGRQYLLEESYTLSLRDGQWKYIKPTDKKATWVTNEKKIESGLSSSAQLFNLAQDPQEQNNLAKSQPLKVSQLNQKLTKIVNKTKRE